MPDIATADLTLPPTDAAAPTELPAGTETPAVDAPSIEAPASTDAPAADAPATDTAPPAPDAVISQDTAPTTDAPAPADAATPAADASTPAIPDAPAAAPATDAPAAPTIEPVADSAPTDAPKAPDVAAPSDPARAAEAPAPATPAESPKTPDAPPATPVPEPIGSPAVDQASTGAVTLPTSIEGADKPGAVPGLNTALPGPRPTVQVGSDHFAVGVDSQTVGAARASAAAAGESLEDYLAAQGVDLGAAPGLLQHVVKHHGQGATKVRREWTTVIKEFYSSTESEKDDSSDEG
jgi:hypothetical protein